MHLSPHEADDMCPHDHQNGVPSAPESLVTPPAPWPLRAPQPRPSIKSTLPDRNQLAATSAVLARISDISSVVATIRKAVYRQYFWEADNALKKPMGEVAVVRNGTTPQRKRSDYWNGHIPWLPTAKVNDKYITRADEFITPTALKECSLTIIPSDSTLVAMIGQGNTRGRAALLQMDATINQNFAAVTPSPSVYSRFLYYQLDALYRALRFWSQGSNQHALNCRLIAAFRIWVPPIPTQMMIVRHLDRSADAERACSARTATLRAMQKAIIESLFASPVTNGEQPVRRSVQRGHEARPSHSEMRSQS